MTPGNDNQQNIRESQEFLELAVNCRFITSQQEQEILPRLFEYSKDQSARSAARFLLEQKVLSKEQIESLFAIKKHLNTLMADKKFGKIGVANDFVSEKKVKKALDIQVSIFRKRKKSVKIGDILVNNNDMSVEDQTAVLLTQDRIKDEYLAEAMGAIGSSEMERIEINRRFGAIAVKKGLINTRQLNQALKRQEKLAEEGTKQYLGEILKEMFDVSDSDVLSVLKIQKKFETRRMKLEENMTRYSRHKELNQTLDSCFEYQVSEDRLAAYVRRLKKGCNAADAGAFIEWLALVGIRYGLCPEKEISAFLQKDEPGEQLLVAQGHLPETNASSVRFYFDTDENPEISHRVKEGEILARYTQSGSGKAGTDVFGRSVDLPESNGPPLICGEGVARKGQEYVAMIEGRPKLVEGRSLFVIPAAPESVARKIQGDVLSDVIEPDLMLEIEGSVIVGVHVSCRKAVIKGDILGRVTAADDIRVNGHIGSEDDSAESARVSSKGVVHAGKDIVNAVIIGEGGVNVSRADIISSRVTSFCDIVSENIRSRQNSPSILWVGREVVLKTAQIDHEIQMAECELDKIMFKDELDALSDELLEKVQIQNSYLEKQNITKFLHKVFQEPESENVADIYEKINSFEKRQEKPAAGERASIFENTKAKKFLNLICGKIDSLSPDDQKQYARELHENISGMYKAAVRETERVNKRYKARSEAIDIQIEKLGAQIEEKKKKIEKLMAEKDYLRLKQEAERACPHPVIKVKNQVSRYTIIKGEKTQRIIDRDVYGVTLEEVNRESDADAKIDIEGYFE